MTNVTYKPLYNIVWCFLSGVIKTVKWVESFLSLKVALFPKTPEAKLARLRRLCEKKPSGKLNCPEWLHNLWAVPANRDDLVNKLEKAGWDKDQTTRTTMSKNIIGLKV